MINLGLPHLRAIGLLPAIASAAIVPLIQACERFSIDTPERVAAFLGQVQVESTDLRHLEEDLFYRSPDRIVDIFRVPLLRAAQLARNPEALANAVYASRLGNGDEASGDGWRFHGRGPIQTTGRANYRAAAEGCGMPYETHPDLLRELDDGCLASAFFWSSNGLNELADEWRIDDITRRVNGKRMLEAETRRQRSEKALIVLRTVPM